MAAKKKATKRSARVPENRAHVLRVSLIGPEPEIWRRVLIHSELDFGTLHDVLQAVMGWEKSHLHQFRVRNQRITDPGFGLDSFDPEDTVWSEAAVTLEEALPKAGEVFDYEYDFGDGWRHRITVEEIQSFDVDPPIVWCLDGAGACPPEDCGGPPGHHHLKTVMADPASPDFEEMVEWLGGPYDPNAFDARAVNRELCRWVLSQV